MKRAASRQSASRIAVKNKDSFVYKYKSKFSASSPVGERHLEGFWNTNEGMRKEPRPLYINDVHQLMNYYYNYYYY